MFSKRTPYVKEETQLLDLRPEKLKVLGRFEQFSKRTLQSSRPSPFLFCGVNIRVGIVTAHA